MSATDANQALMCYLKIANILNVDPKELIDGDENK
jgi:hypothetical protein